MAINFKRFWKGIKIVPKTTSGSDSKGDLEVIDSSGKLNYHNGSNNSPVVTEAHSATLTNKNLSDSTVVIVDATDATKQVKIDVAGTTGTSTTITSSQTVDRTITLPDATDTLVGKATTDILTNKTIDANGTGNSISNLETADLAAGVLNTDVAMTGASNTQVPSALAIKTYVDDKAAAQDQASEISYSNTTSGLAATNVQAAVDEVDTNLDSHIASTTSHGATGAVVGTTNTQTLSNKTLDNSSIVSVKDSNLTIQDDLDATKQVKIQASGLTTLTTRTLSVPNADGTIVLDTNAQTITNKTIAAASNTITTAASGNLVATELNAALSELQSDIDTRATTTALNDHLVDTIDAHDASAISVVASGNLAATEVQAALVEHQGDIDSINANKVSGPASATDNAIPRYDLTTGKLIKNSGVTVSDTNVMSGLAGLTTSGDLNSTGKLVVAGITQEGTTTDGSTTGANVTLATPSNGILRLTNASLSSIDMISGGFTGQSLTIINHTGNSITINDNTGATLASRILTGTKAALTLADEASIHLKYDATETRWMVIGGSGSGSGSQSLDTVFQLYGEELVSAWTTGNNATFLGAGTLAGTFVKDEVTPLNGDASYKYTQAVGSLNDYIASADQDVALRFRGQTCTLYFPYQYDGANDDITPVIYDVTNATVLVSGGEYALDATNGGTSVYKTNVVIPLTCTQIRGGFQVLVANSGKILEFDDVQLTSDTTVYADIENTTDWTSYTPSLSGAPTSSAYGRHKRNGDSLELMVTFVLSGAASGQFSFSLPSGLTIDGDKLPTGNQVAVGSAQALESGISFKAGTAVVKTPGNTIEVYSHSSGNSWGSGNPHTWKSGDTLTVKAIVPIEGWISSDINILTAPETFSTDTASLTYASSSQYTLSTLADAPVGTFITYTYAASSNTRTQTTAAPTQTTSDMNTNGVLLYTRAFNVDSTSAQPAVVAIQIGKGHKGLNTNIYKSTGKVNSGVLDSLLFDSTTDYGVRYNQYNESTGILLIDGGAAWTSTNTIHSIRYVDDDSTQTNGYLVINASKNPALTGINLNRVAARAVQSSGQNILNNTSTVVTWDSIKTFDTHGALNTSTGVFACPLGEGGYYDVTAQISLATSAATATLTMYIFKNGSEYARYTLTIPNVANTYSISLADKIPLIVGDTLDVRVTHNTGTTRALSTVATSNFFSIAKIGN